MNHLNASEHYRCRALSGTGRAAMALSDKSCQPPVELACGKDPGEQGGHDDRPAKKDDGMRKTQSCRGGRQGARMVLLVCYLGVSAI